jgi:hypothetical protein
LNIRALAILVVLLLTQILSVQAYQPGEDGWESVAPGIDYQLFVLPTPNRIHVARMERSNEDAIIESSIAAGRLARGSETTTQMANRYNDSLSSWQKAGDEGWVWGRRSQVAVAINGFYIENWFSYTPQSGQIHSGWYAKRFVAPNGDPISSSGFAWKLDRSAFIGDCVYHNPIKQPIYFVDTDTELFLSGVNTSRGTNSLVIYSPQYDIRTPIFGVEVEVLVELTRPSLVIPPSSVDYVTGYIREVRTGGPPFILPYDHLVISGTGLAGALLLQAVDGYEEGDGEVRFSQEIQNYIGENCTIVAEGNWNKTFASIGGQFIFLQDGVIEPYEENEGAVVRHPRTAVAYNDQYIYFIVVDGRAPGFSIGMTIAGLAWFAQEYLEATWGIAEDGGGSSTMVINGKVVNRPSDPCTKTFFPVIKQDAPIEKPFIYDLPQPFSIDMATCERRTGNGLMMVVIQEPEFSNTFYAGETVVTNAAANVRRGPGTNYDIIGTAPSGALGEILQPLNQLEGVYAKGKYWWKVEFEAQGLTGWIIEDALRSGEFLLQRLGQVR